METNWIEDFVTLVEVRSFTKAAELRNLSQAAFSRRIQSLEHWIGSPLISRSTYPLSLSKSGEQFYARAISLLNQIAEIKAEVGINPPRNHLKIAMSYTIATTWLPDWWVKWSNQNISCSIDVGNVHDTVSSLISGASDLLICFHESANPIQIDLSKFEQYEMGQEIVKPYSSRTHESRALFSIPGTVEKPTPLLMYSPSVYFARVVDSAIEKSGEELNGFRSFEGGMTDVLGDLVAKGLGVAWLPTRYVREKKQKNLIPVGDGKWDIKVSIMAYRAKLNTKHVVLNIWNQILKTKIEID